MGNVPLFIILMNFIIAGMRISKRLVMNTIKYRAIRSEIINDN